MKVITFSKNSLPYAWCSNMSHYPIYFHDKRWFHTEGLFQALRFDDETIIEAIRNERNPIKAKQIALDNADKMVVTPRSKTDIENMRLCLMIKLDQYPVLKIELDETEDGIIIEDVTSRQSSESNSFWGAALINSEWVGENTLGKLWMQIRDRK